MESTSICVSAYSSLGYGIYRVSQNSDILLLLLLLEEKHGDCSGTGRRRMQRSTDDYSSVWADVEKSVKDVRDEGQRHAARWSLSIDAPVWVVDGIDPERKNEMR